MAMAIAPAAGDLPRDAGPGPLALALAPGPADAIVAADDDSGDDAYRRFVAMDHESLAALAVRQSREVTKLRGQLAKAHSQVKTCKKSQRKKPRAIVPLRRGQRKKRGGLGRREAGPEISTIGKYCKTDDALSRLSSPGLLAVAIRRNISNSSSHGFAIAAGV